MARHIIRFFDKIEDRIRGYLSHWPILYGLAGGIGVVLFWRGVWHGADVASRALFAWQVGSPTVDLPDAADALLSFFAGFTLLLATGLFVSNFIGNEIIISGLRGEKKLAEKTEAEVKTETGAIAEIKEEVRGITKRLDELRKT